MSATLRSYAEFANIMTSAQRINNYTQINQEDDLRKILDEVLDKNNWPSKGEIELKNVTMSYRPTLEPSLRGLSFKVQAGMKIGIVGRTGAGKSSIL